MPQPLAQNTLFYGDNLPILREYIAAESIDLIYLDPPFNSQRTYNVLFKEESGQDSEAQIMAFKDTWHWDRSAEETYHEIVEKAPANVTAMIGVMREFIGSNQMMAYLVMMTARLVELHRVLKPTGSLYLHCDSTASHYLKIVLDAIFGPLNFRNEIVWKRTGAHNDPSRYGRNIDTIFFYTKGQEWTWNQQYKQYDDEYLKRFRYSDPDGREWTDGDLTAKGLSGGGYEYEYKGVKSLWRVPLKTMEQLDKEGKLHYTKRGGLRLKKYFDERKGVPLQALWEDIPPINSQSRERLGYPTQKPVALLERIIQASSNEGDLVLDPFCGCGTTIAAAQKLKCKWIGIDITHLSISLQKYRLSDMFGIVAANDYQVIGEPTTVSAALELAQTDRYQFQWWALSLVQAKPVGGETGGKRGKKGADKGIDGIINFIDEGNDKPKKIIVQVKSGHVGRKDIAELVGTTQRENAVIGVFITLEPPTGHMREETVTAGFYKSIHFGQYPKIQILTIEELLQGKTIAMPPRTAHTFKKAQRVGAASAVEQGELSWQDDDPTPAE